MSDKSVEQRVKEVIAREALIQQESVTMEKNLVADLAADSFDLVMIEQGLEDEFGFEVGETDFANISTVADVVNYVERMLGVHHPV